MAQKNIIIFWTLVLLPQVVFGEESSCNETLKVGRIGLTTKTIAIAAILLAGAGGVSLPVIGRNLAAFGPQRNLFLIIKVFAGGVILATGFVHVLADSFDSLTSVCIRQQVWGDFPMPGFVSMFAAVTSLMVDSYATAYYRRKAVVNGRNNSSRDEEATSVEMVPVHIQPTHGHSHGSPGVESGQTDLTRHRVIAQVLELGIVFDSVIIGIALGASQSPKTIKPLIAALSFHQFFEGLGLGGSITQAKLNARTVAVMVVFFSLTTPVGIAIGIGITNVYNATGATALIVQGVFNAISAGILIYMSLVDFLASDFMSPRMQNSFKLQLGASAALLMGVGCMSVLAIWA